AGRAEPGGRRAAHVRTVGPRPAGTARGRGGGGSAPPQRPLGARRQNLTLRTAKAVGFLVQREALRRTVFRPSMAPITSTAHLTSAHAGRLAIEEGGTDAYQPALVHPGSLQVLLIRDNTSRGRLNKY